MGKVSWQRRKEIKADGKIAPTYPSVIRETHENFNQPRAFQDQYRKVLMTDHSHTNYWFKLIRDWYEDKDKTGCDILWIRGEQTPIQWKSAIGNADTKTNFNTDYDIIIHRGDILIRKNDDKIFMLDWNVQEDIINQNSQTIECNTYFEFKRVQDDVTDDDGYLVHDREEIVVVPSIPGVAAEYTGRPDFEVSQSTVGITSGDLLTCYVQWNPTTKNMRIGDTFIFGDYTYRVENISIERVDITRTYGTIMFHGRRVTGGDLNV